MHAMLFERYGEPEVLVSADLPEPKPGPGEVCVRVAYAGVNFAEVMFRRGQIPVGLPHVPGLEVSGTVETVGPGVEDLQPGQRVAALTLDGGGYAEKAIARADLTTPVEVPLQQAAAFPCNVTTAWGVLRSAARLAPGESVLVLAAAGGVGTAAAQIARLHGAATVLGAASSPDKRAYARSFGYDGLAGYDHLADLVRQHAGDAGVDVILDSVGGPGRAEAASLLAPFGRQVIFGDAAEQDISVEANSLWFGGYSLAGYNLGGLAHRSPHLLRSHLESAAGLVAGGDLRLDITEFGLADAAKAHRLLTDRASTGKLVLRVAD